MKLRNLHLSDISLSCLARAVLRDLWTVIAAALILAMSVSLYFDWFHQDVYSGNMTYAITSRRTSFVSGTNTAAAKEVASLLSEMLETDMVTRRIRGYDPRLEAFSGTITASQVSSTNFVVISVEDSSPERIFLALQAIIEISPELTDYVAENCVVQIIRNPQVGTAPINSVNVRAYSLLAGLGGAAAMAAVLCWFCIRRETIQTRSGARRMLAAPILASVQRERGRTLRSLLKKSRRPLQVFAPTTSFAYTEQINTICTRLEQEAATAGSRIFLFTGVSENEGKSTVAANVAAALALMGKKVALVDCDLRNPSLNQFFDEPYSAPLPLNLLLSQPLTQERLAQCVQVHPTLGLTMLFSLRADRRCAELLAGRPMAQLIKALGGFEFVILDTPPMGYFADAESLARLADASVLVVRQDATPAPDVNDHIDVLRSCHAGFLGVVLNRMTASLTEGYGYGYGYGSRYGYGGHYGYGDDHGRDPHEKGGS